MSKKEFVDKLKGKCLEVCPSVTSGVTFTVCNQTTNETLTIVKVSDNTWMAWGSTAYPMLTDRQLEDVLWDMYVDSGREKTNIRINDEFGCMTWVF